MAKRKYGARVARKVGKVMREYKRGILKSGRSGKKVKSRRQAVAIGLSQARSRTSSRSGRSRPSTRSASRSGARSR